MFTLIEGLPPYAVGVVASGTITAGDYKDVLEPALNKALAEWKGVNLLFVLQADIKDFTLGAWVQDIRVNTRYFLKWNKLAMVDHHSVLTKITSAFDVIAPGEARSFTQAQLEEAKAWVSLP